MSGTIWSKFYWSDWRSEPSIRMVSLAARGLWIEMLALMAEAEPYGHLLVNGKAPTDAQLALLVGATPKQVKALREELETAGTYSRTASGVIFSRRMVRDLERAQKGREAVAKRWEKDEKPNRAPNRSPTSTSGEHLKGSSGNSHKPDTNSHKPKAREDSPSAAAAPPGEGDELDLDMPVSLDRECQEAFARYNLAAEQHGLPKAQVLNDRRRASLKLRLKECGGLDGWDAALEHLGRSAFLRGGGPSGWRADFDFLLQQSSFIKLLEGGYDDAPRRNERAMGDPASVAADDIIRQIRENAA